jgi:hypothetical protein
VRGGDAGADRGIETIPRPRKVGESLYAVALGQRPKGKSRPKADTKRSPGEAEYAIRG